MKIELHKIISAANANDPIKGLSQDIVSAIGAAYWAGQTNGIHQERAKTRHRMESLEFGRYHQIERRIARTLAPAHEMRAVEGLSAEASEIKAWDFEL